MRDAGIVHQDVNAFLPRDLVEDSCDIGKGGDIARVRGGSSSGTLNLTANRFGVLLVDVESTNFRSARREPQRDRAANAAARAGDHSAFSVQAKFVRDVSFAGQRDTPRFHGMKSS